MESDYVKGVKEELARQQREKGFSPAVKHSFYFDPNIGQYRQVSKEEGARLAEKGGYVIRSTRKPTTPPETLRDPSMRF